jgi:HTH-type transcriptional regulator / antitoxin HigA
MNITPIKNHEDYLNILDQINQLSNSQPGTEEFDVLDILLTLVEAYESKITCIELPSPIESILFAMDRLNLTRRDLEIYIGSSGRVSEILNRERRLTLGMIRKLSKGLCISADVLLQEYPLQQQLKVA